MQRSIELIQIDNNPIRTEWLEKFFLKKPRQADSHFQVFALLLITKILFPMTTQKRNCSSVQTSFQFFHGELSFIYTFNNHTQRKKINWSVTELSNKRIISFRIYFSAILQFYDTIKSFELTEVLSIDQKTILSVYLVT